MANLSAAANQPPASVPEAHPNDDASSSDAPTPFALPAFMRGKTVQPDARTTPHHLATSDKIAWVASPADTQIFICSVSDCNTLYPSAARLSAHQTAAHLPGVLRESITWFDPAAEQAEEEAERERKAEKDREAARRSFMPLP